MDRTEVIKNIMTAVKADGIMKTEESGIDVPNLPASGVFELRENSYVKSTIEQPDGSKKEIAYIKIFVQGYDDSMFTTLSALLKNHYFGSAEDVIIKESKKGMAYIANAESAFLVGGGRIPAGELEDKLKFIDGKAFSRCEQKDTLEVPFDTPIDEFEIEDLKPKKAFKMLLANAKPAAKTA